MRIKGFRVQGLGFRAIALALTLLSPNVAGAQCAMCRASLEGSDNVQKAEAVNDGIVYLMVFPYLIVGIIGVVIYRMYSKKKAQ